MLVSAEHHIGSEMAPCATVLGLMRYNKTTQNAYYRILPCRRVCYVSVATNPVVSSPISLEALVRVIPTVTSLGRNHLH